MSAEHVEDVRCSHLSRAQLDQLRHLLTDQRAALTERLSSEEGQVADVERSLAEAATARTVEALEEVGAALARIDSGAYGSCTSCGDAIPFERLEAVPATARCVRCQARAATLLR
jgi:RNA polymerase-binding transcription factor DksA